MKLRQRGKIWYYRYIDATGRLVERKGCADKRVTEEMRREAESRAARERAGCSILARSRWRSMNPGRSPTTSTTARRDTVAKGNTERHADQYRDRAGKLIALAIGTPAEEIFGGQKREEMERSAATLARVLANARLSRLSPERIQSALATLRDAGKANQTANHFRAAGRALSRWAVDQGRLRESPMRGTSGFNVEEDASDRRILSDDEFDRTVRAAENGPVVFGMTGPLRAMAYRAAAGTGFRVNELRSLTPESFKLDGPEPTISLLAAGTKNGKPAVQPIAESLARELRLWLVGKPPGRSVFPLHHETAKAMARDLEAVGIAYETDEGTADFHALRSFYATSLIRSGANIAEFHKLSAPNSWMAHGLQRSLGKEVTDDTLF